ncbi:MAG: YggT family protein [Patescibacteria group bacterium]
MAELIKETKIEATNSQTVEYLVYFFFGVLEVLLAFRLVLKLTGASLASAFVGLIYGLTGIFILPFEGIFRRGYAQGVETTSVLEPSTLVAIVVYAVLAWGIVKLIRVLSGEKQVS